jgi:hypothetical protein
MTHEKKHSTLPLSQPEVYNKDLEKLVEVLQDKLEGAELREEYLKNRVEEMKKRVYCVSVYTQAPSQPPGPYPSTLVFCSTIEEAEKHVADHIRDRKLPPLLDDDSYLQLRLYLPHKPPESKIIKWGIESIALGTDMNKNGVITHYKAYNPDGSLTI